MKAAFFHETGSPDVLRYADVATPEPGHGEVLVKVGACGMNRYDLYMRMGAVFPDTTFPHIVGADVAGTIAAIGEGVEDWSEGDRVIVAPGYPIDPADWDVQPENCAPSFEVTGTHTWGGNADFIRVPSRFVFRDETDLPAVEVAAMPLVLMTAVHAVETLGEVKSGDRILVQAGASGSGNACVQVARAIGSHVAATVGSDDKIESTKRAGAELVINYRTHNFADALLDWTDGVGVRTVIDNVGASVLQDNLRCLRHGGIFVNFGLVGGMHASLNIRDLFFRQHQLRGSFMGSFDELRRGLGLLRDGKVRAFIDRTYPLSEVAEAHRFLETRQVQGKVVLIP